MQQRPISILVDALRSLGAEIEYVKNEGFPPLNIKGFTQKNKAVTVAGDVSSQYISALLMVAPTLPQGLELTLAGEVASRPYIEMTLDLMKHFGVTALWEGNQISVAPQNYQPSTYSIESDWSGASYWFSVVALAEKAELTLLGLRKNSLQGDSVIVKIMDSLGVSTEITEGGLRLSKKESVKYFEFNFADCPDLAQTVSVVCAAKGIKAKLYGLKSLRIKETDRIAAIEKELGKFGAKITVEGDDAIYIETSHLDFSLAKVHTYEDHRMAMAFAPLALLHPIEIEDPSVVNKSYPSFWKHLALAGFSCDVK
jgi:3-phosphoshikimate 1-carboxyvinyltransferase